MPLLATAVLALTMMQGADTAPPAQTAPYTTLPNRLRSWFHLRQQSGGMKLPKAVRQSNKVRERFWKADKWTITVKSDGFTGAVQCRLHRHTLMGKRDDDVSYADGAVGFRHSFQADPSKIWFRIDNQPAQPWTSVYRDLSARGLTVVPYRAGYDTDDVLLLPADPLLTASQVTLRLSEKSKPEVFDISGLGTALAASKQLGCTDESFIR